ncbi:hypothetical protein GCM10009780_35870 [Actinomadura alba]
MTSRWTSTDNTRPMPAQMHDHSGEKGAPGSERTRTAPLLTRDHAVKRAAGSCSLHWGVASQAHTDTTRQSGTSNYMIMQRVGARINA